MLTRWNQGWTELDEMFSTMNQLRTYMDRVFGEESPERGWEWALATGWPRVNLVDNGETLALTAEVPGLSEKDIKLSLNQDVVTLEGERKPDAPKGYSTHRQERTTVQFSRSFTLPCLVNPDRATATVRNGLLTVTLEKATEALPRQISVKAS